MKSPKEFENCAERLRALADPDRLRIVLRLFEGERNVGQIAAELGEDVVKISHHLGVLRHAKIVSAKRDGRFVVYRLHPNVTLQSVKEGPLTIELGCCRLDLAQK